MLTGVTDDILAIVREGPDIASSAAAILKKVKPHIGVVRGVVEDPGFVPVMERVKQVITIEDAKERTKAGLPPAPPVKPGEVPKSMQGGIGLRRAVPILDGYIFVLKNPWAGYVGVAAFLGLFVGAGYALGKRSRK